ncbi:hypothetical protein EDD22DRAFT_919836 [Suillus occidentalis]|nr:hypothetical protein EDD22DRAFT_919836 [Suillus occidentalis]
MSSLLVSTSACLSLLPLLVSLYIVSACLFLSTANLYLFYASACLHLPSSVLFFSQLILSVDINCPHSLIELKLPLQ